jgi:hypothetical protein
MKQMKPTRLLVLRDCKWYWQLIQFFPFRPTSVTDPQINRQPE